MVYFYVGQPVSHTACIGYCIRGRNYDLDQPDSVLQGVRGHELLSGPASGGVPTTGAR